ncbi:MAG: right-handed parallel beta-helix repeat-containing protein [Candidatus Eisenbacteria bacterium]
MRRTLMVFVLVLVGTPVAGYAATWNVPGDALTVQAGIDSASAGDTVLVAPDTYYENLVMKDGVVLTSSGGRDVTTLEPAIIDSPIVDCTSLGAGTVIEGFTFRNGDSFVGAGVKCIGSEIAILDNRFTLNHASNGAGIAMSDSSDGVIDGNAFEDNVAGNWGGGIFLEHSSPDIIGNTFGENGAKYGAAIGIMYSSSPHVADNTFIGNSASRQGGAIHCRYNGFAVIERNWFESNSAGGSAGAIAFHEDAYPTVRENIFWKNSGGNAAVMGVSFSSDALIENNTFYANDAFNSTPDSLPACIGVYSNSTAGVYNCIFAHGTGGPAIGCFQGATATVDCNDLWSNDSDYLGCGPGLNDFYLDPLLCDPDNGDFQLDCSSPCANHPVCGLVGAMDVGCGASRTETSTWSSIKARYR